MFEGSKTFDVIVAGAGPAGCVLASRLSEDAGRHVLLIEAGGDAPPGEEDPEVLDPFPVSSRNAAYHWPGLFAETDAAPADGAARIARPYLQAFGVGGASNINGMGADRGLPGDYDEWRDLGAEHWGWDDVLPYFNKLERDLDAPGLNRSSVHGDSGPMPVRRLPRSRWAPFCAALGDTLQRRGFAYLEDYNADFRAGFGAAPTNSLPEGRVSASMAYLTTEVRRRPNLAILARAHVERIGLQGTRANGVFVRVDGASKFVAGRQVIVACGALQSPALLMRSGIGPAEHLMCHGIDVVRDLPAVGANLLNHPCVNPVMYLPRRARQSRDNLWLLQNWLRFSSNHPGCVPNDMHLLPINKCAWHALGSRVATVAVTIFKAYSQGSVELASADPTVAPKIKFNLLDDPRDYERLVSGLRFLLELLADPAVARMHGEMFVPDAALAMGLGARNTWNGFKARAIAGILDRAPLRRRLLAKATIDPRRLLADEKALRDYVRRNAHPQYHVCGTCRMGRADDAQTVVDATGAVHGMQALRVADASIFPTIPRANIHYTVIMAAEKIADAIKAQEPRVRAARRDPDDRVCT